MVHIAISTGKNSKVIEKQFSYRQTNERITITCTCYEVVYSATCFWLLVHGTCEIHIFSCNLEKGVYIVIHVLAKWQSFHVDIHIK